MNCPNCHLEVKPSRKRKLTTGVRHDFLCSCGTKFITVNGNLIPRATLKPKYDGPFFADFTPAKQKRIRKILRVLRRELAEARG